MFKFWILDGICGTFFGMSIGFLKHSKLLESLVAGVFGICLFVLSIDRE